VRPETSQLEVGDTTSRGMVSYTYQVIILIFSTYIDGLLVVEHRYRCSYELQISHNHVGIDAWRGDCHYPVPSISPPRPPLTISAIQLILITYIHTISAHIKLQGSHRNVASTPVTTKGTFARKNRFSVNIHVFPGQNGPSLVP